MKECGPTHYNGCPCHEEGWHDRVSAVVEAHRMAAAERDRYRAALEEAHETLDNLCASLVNLKALPDSIHVSALRGSLPRLRDEIAAALAPRTGGEEGKP